jgi:hypothetical protein
MDKLIEYLPFIIPVILVELVLMVAALVHLLKHKRVRFGNQILWILIIAFIQIIGPILYFTVGRGED